MFPHKVLKPLVFCRAGILIPAATESGGTQGISFGAQI